MVIPFQIDEEHGLCAMRAGGWKLPWLPFPQTAKPVWSFTVPAEIQWPTSKYGLF